MPFSGQCHQRLISGFFLSIKLSVPVFVLALPLTITVALLHLVPVVLLRGIGQTYVKTTHNVLLLAHMLFWHFGAPQILPEFIRDRLYSTDYETASAVTAFVLYTAAYMMEDICSGTHSIPKKQLEASHAFGLSFLQAIRLAVLPQSLRIIVPLLVSQASDLWKNPGTATVIGVAKLMYQAQQVESVTLRGFEALAFTAAAYLTISTAVMVLSTWYRHRYPT